MNDAYCINEAEITERIQESPDIFTIKMRLDNKIAPQYAFAPGQFNMLYLYGIGEIPISIVAYEKESGILTHTIRVVGRLTNGFNVLKKGDKIGIRGPFGRGWPLEEAINKDIVIITGGLGAVPLTAAVNYILGHRDKYGELKILQGVKCSAEHIYCERYDIWSNAPGTKVILSADEGDPNWPWAVGFVTEQIKNLKLNPDNTIALTCGPEIMMRIAADHCIKKDISPKNIYLSMERSMHCGLGHCGHCQFGGVFVCKDGPVFSYSEVHDLLGRKGF